MQTLYGVRITDRATVIERGPGAFQAMFDDEFVGTFPNGRLAVHGITEFLKQRQKAREAAAAQEAARQQYAQEHNDYLFLHDLATRLGIEPSDLDTLIEIANRRRDA